MKKYKFLIWALVLLVAVVASPFTADAFYAQSLPTRHSQEMKVLDNAIGQQFQALVNNGETTEVEPQETFGTRSFGLVLTIVEAVRAHVRTFVTNFADFPRVGAWIEQQYDDPILNDRWSSLGQLIVLVLGTAFAASIFTRWLFTSPRQHFTRRRNNSFAERLGAATGWLALTLIPVIVFVGVSLIIMNESDPPKLERLVVMGAVYATALWRVVILSAGFVLAPKFPRLRLVSLSDVYAKYFSRWILRLSFVMIYGYFFVDVARLVRLPAGAITAFSSLLGFVIVAMAITIIIQKRELVALLLRGDLYAAKHELTMWQSLRIWLAKIWHQLAISYLVIGYAVTMLSVGGGFDLMLKGTILTLALLITMRLALIGISRMTFGRMSNISGPVLRNLLRFAVWIITVMSIAASWGFDVVGFIYSPWGQRITGSVFSITVTLLVATFAYESLNSFIERKLNRRDSSGNPILPTSRARTLLPMSRHAALIFLASIVVFMTLSELGVNIAPLLAGAGVIGVAIGFGSQSLVKDFITGLFMLMEDAVAIGDIVRVGEHAGVVEGMTIRTLRLRSLNGDLHIVPFGDVTAIVNSSKEFAYAVMDIGVAYDSDLRKVIKVITAVGDEIRVLPEFSADVLEPIEVLGVDQLADSAIVVRCRMKTVPGKQYQIRREYLMRVKEWFDRENIEIPFPTIKHITVTSSLPKSE